MLSAGNLDRTIVVYEIHASFTLCVLTCALKPTPSALHASSICWQCDATIPRSSTAAGADSSRRLLPLTAARMCALSGMGAKLMVLAMATGGVVWYYVDRLTFS